eukprot:1147821-Pelagomonas_calceolata.AAC.9
MTSESLLPRHRSFSSCTNKSAVAAWHAVHLLDQPLLLLPLQQPVPFWKEGSAAEKQRGYPREAASLASPLTQYSAVEGNRGTQDEHMQRWVRPGLQVAALYLYAQAGDWGKEGAALSKAAERARTISLPTCAHFLEERGGL